MLIKVMTLVACIVAAVAGEPDKPPYVPQVGISKGVRSQSPDIIYLSAEHDDRYDVPLGPQGQLDQNNLIAAVYGPAFLRPEWIWNGDRHIDQDRGSNRDQNQNYNLEKYGNYGRSQYESYNRDRYGNYERGPSNSYARGQDPYGRAEGDRQLYGPGINNQQYAHGYVTPEEHNDNEEDLSRIRHQGRSQNIKRIKDQERIIDTNKLLQEQERLLERKRLRENERLIEILKQKDRELQRERERRPHMELERLRALEMQRQLRQRDHVPIEEGVGDRMYPGYDYPAGRYGEAGRENARPHGGDERYQPAWARLPDVAFHGRSPLGHNRAEY